MSTLNALASKYQIAVPLRTTDLPKVLTITKIATQKMPDGQGGREDADVLTGKADNGTIYTVRLNEILVSQLVRIFGPNTEIEGQRLLASAYEKGDRAYVSFAHAPAPTPAAPAQPVDKHLPAPLTPETRHNGHGKDEPKLSEDNKQLLAEIAART